MTGPLYALFLLGVLLSAGDGLLTVLVLQRGGVERNPLYAALFRRLPAALVLLVTKTAMAWLTYLLAEELIRRGERQAALAVLGFGVALFGYLVVRNWRVLRRQQTDKGEAA